MKIKHIIQTIQTWKEKCLVAFRIYTCTPEIKKAIKIWIEKEDLPMVEIKVSDMKQHELIISAHELVNLYGYKELPALLMLDDLIKANSDSNKTRLIELLSTLIAGKHKHSNGSITPELLDQIRQTQPGIWKEYEKISENVREIEKEYDKIIEYEI